MSNTETTAKVSFEQAREDEDTHQWIARLHRENIAKARAAALAAGAKLHPRVAAIKEGRANGK